MENRVGRERRKKATGKQWWPGGGRECLVGREWGKSESKRMVEEGKAVEEGCRGNSHMLCMHRAPQTLRPALLDSCVYFIISQPPQNTSVGAIQAS